MVGAIRHRGPDDSGWWIGDDVGLGNTRLAILDLSDAGHQPMQSEEADVVLVYNGELYNFRELRVELESTGHRFRSRSDTEVVLHSYCEWGIDCVRKFNGMFALAVWDRRSRILHLARDRFGVKPLYYAQTNGSFIFASEVKALIAGGYRPTVCFAALAEYFTFQNVYSDLTLFDGVRILPPASILSVADGEPSVRRYWDFELEPDDGLEEAAWIDLIATSFDRAVTRQLVSDVPVGSYLSGGMDSASIAAIASRSIPRLMTFTGGFDLSSVSGLEMVFDERADAEAIASAFRTEHYEMVMHAGDMAWVLPELVWHLEDLRVGMSYQNHYIARLASKFVKVVLAGTGGDELFAGYPWRYEKLQDGDDRAFAERHYAYWSRLVPDEVKSDFFSNRVWSHVVDTPPRSAYERVMEPVADRDPLSKALYFEAKTFLHGLLVVEDKVSMAHSLESRVPFLDDDLVDIARRIPSNLRHSGTDGKRLLRLAMREVLPEAIVTKKKQGFSPPDQAWYRGQTMPYIEKILLDPRSLSRDYFNHQFIRRTLREHFEGKVNHRLLIWSLLAFEWWNRLFIDGEPTARHVEWHVERGNRTSP